jgi:hypothetical protein
MSTEPEFTDHYEISGEILHTYAKAKEAAEGNEARIWFIREGEDESYWTEECGETSPDPEDEDDTWYEAMTEEYGSAPWTVEPYDGQFVNCLGFFVSTEPCKPEHINAVFRY